jgi:hypothetical protein
MNNSTEHVTLAAAFVKDILDLYKDNEADYLKLKDMAKGLDLSAPTNITTCAIGLNRK